MIQTCNSLIARTLIIIFACFFLSELENVHAQPSVSGLEHLFKTPRHYVACFTNERPVIDGVITDDVWDNAVWSDYFRNIEGDLKPDPPLRTRMKMLWDDKYLYIAAELEEPHVWAYLQQHDDIVYYDNDFEIFIDPRNTTHQYFEIEVNARNTIFDLFMPRAYRNGSGALISWDAPGLQSAVKVNGTLNDPTDKDRGWTVEMAIPFAAVTVGNTPGIPRDGHTWRINFSRVEWHTDITDGKYVRRTDSSGKILPEENWVWSPQGFINMHAPERWGYLMFSKQTNPSQAPAFIMPYSEKQRQYLWLVYYRQKDFLQKNRRYALTLDELNINPSVFEMDGQTNTLVMEATGRQFFVVIESEENRITINDEGLTGTNRRRNN